MGEYDSRVTSKISYIVTGNTLDDAQWRIPPDADSALNGPERMVGATGALPSISTVSGSACLT